MNLLQIVTTALPLHFRLYIIIIVEVLVLSAAKKCRCNPFLTAKNKFLQTRLFFVTIYYKIILKVNTVKGFSLVTKCNKFKKPP